MEENAPIAMRTTAIVAVIAFLAAMGPAAHGEEARAALYVVDRSEDGATSKGVCRPYTPEEKPGPDRELLILAEAPIGSTVFIMAFDRDAPYLGLPPLLAEQGKSSQVVRYPADGARWPFEPSPAAVELFIVVFDKGDPELPKIAESANWLTEALKKKNEVESLLHAESLKKRLTQLKRENLADNYRDKFGDGLRSLRQPPSSKAAVSRKGLETTGSPDGVLDSAPTATKPDAPAVVERSLDQLEEEWRQDSRPIPHGLASPGVLVLSVAPTVAP